MLNFKIPSKEFYNLRTLIESEIPANVELSLILVENHKEEFLDFYKITPTQYFQLKKNREWQHKFWIEEQFEIINNMLEYVTYCAESGKELDFEQKSLWKGIFSKEEQQQMYDKEYQNIWEGAYIE